MFLHWFYCKSFFFCLLLWCERFCLKQGREGHKSLLEKESVHLPPNSLSSEYVEDAGDTGQLLPPKLCRHWVSLLQHGIRAKHRWFIKYLNIVCVCLCLCPCICLSFYPFMCVLHLKYTHRSTFVFGCTMHLDRFPASLEKQVGWWNWLTSICQHRRRKPAVDIFWNFTSISWSATLKKRRCWLKRA